jgi:hypothetical protein
MPETGIGTVPSPAQSTRFVERSTWYRHPLTPENHTCAVVPVTTAPSISGVVDG